MIGSAALVLGLLVYATDRDAASAMLFPAMAALDSGAVFGAAGAWLPSFIHPFAFSLFTAAALARGARPAYRACAAWWAVNMAFEVAQHARFSGAIAEFLHRAFGDAAVGQALANYALRGSFDLADIAALTAGSLAAAAVLYLVQARQSATRDESGSVRHPGLHSHVLKTAVAALGLAGILGSGGGGALGFPDLSCLNLPGGCGGGNPPPTPIAQIYPYKLTAQVGGTVAFTVWSNVDQPTYRWCRIPAAASECTDIPGATDATYQLTGANLGDDGMTLRVTVSGTNGTTWAMSQIAVSSMPGVTFQDGDFLATDWDITTQTVPATGGPTISISRVTDGGNPGTFRTARYDMPVVPSSARVFYSALSATYDPTAQGAIYTIDFIEDCIAGPSAGLLSYTGPLIEQAGRRYIAAHSLMSCKSTTWSAVRRSSVAGADFERVDGPACGASESCPDFSAAGAPIRLGLVGGTEFNGGLVPPTQSGHGFDNWKVTVWRR
jgi:hypothetical protein